MARQAKLGIFFLGVALFFAAHGIFAQSHQAPQATQAPAKPEPTLEQLSHADLIRQAGEILNTAEQDFLTKKRSVFITGASYRQQQLERRDAKLSAPDTQSQTPPATNPLREAERQFQLYRAYYSSVQRSAAWADKAIALLNKKIGQNIATQRAGDTLLATIKQLSTTHLLEINLRYQDGTLSADQVPEPLRKAHIDQLNQTVPSIQADLRTLMLADVNQIKELNAYNKQITHLLQMAANQLADSEQVFEQLSQQQALETKYADKTPADMAQILDKLHKERIWLQGSLSLALHKFSEREKQAQTAEQTLGALPDPQEIPGTTDAVDAAEAARMVEQTQQLIQHYQQRLDQLNTWHTAIKEMAELGKGLQADLKLQNQQLLTMQFLAKKLDGVSHQPAGPDASDGAPPVDALTPDTPATDAATAGPTETENTQAADNAQAATPPTDDSESQASTDDAEAKRTEENTPQPDTGANATTPAEPDAAPTTTTDTAIPAEGDNSTPADAGDATNDLEGADNAQPDYAQLAQNLGVALEQNNQRLRNVTNQSQAKQQQIDAVAGQASDAKQDVARYQEVLRELEKTVAILQKTEQYSQQLASLSAQQVVQHFTDNQQALEDARKAQTNLHTRMEQAVSATETAKDNLFALKDPLMRAAAAKNTAEKARIRHALYALANLDEAKQQKASADPIVGDALDPEPGDLSKKIQFYSNLLTNRVRILENREQQRLALLDALQTQKQAQEKYIEQFSVIQQLLLERYATAVELRKRLGQEQLDGSAVPEGAIEALQRNDLNRIDEERASATYAVNQTEYDIEHFGRFGGLQKEIVDGLSGIQILSGKRLDLLNDIRLLNADLKERLKKQTEAEQKTQQQTALRRMESESSLLETVLSFMPSESAESIEELLQSYYVELMQLENEQENLLRQTEHTGELAKLAADETQSIESLIPMLTSHYQQQTQHRDTFLTLVQAQLVGREKADQILDQYYLRTGQRLPEPVPLPDTYKAPAIELASQILFEWHVQLAAMNDWITLLKQRAGATGLGQESSYYNDNLATLNSQQTSIQRRISNLSGHSPEELAALAEIDRPQNADEERAFLLGGIGIGRENLLESRTQGAITVIITVISIIIGAIILLWLVNYLIDRKIKHLKQTEPGNDHMLLAWAAIRSLARIAIIITAFVMVLSSFGIQVGAILAGLGIGGLAVAMAAKESLANILAGVMIFLEKPFKVGDEIQIGDSEAAKVQSIGWRSTCVVTQFGYTIHIPNSQVSETTVTNYTKQEITGDYVSVLVPQEYNPEHIQRLLDEALGNCPSIQKNAEKGTLVVGVKIIYENAWMEYQPCWFTDDYHRRDQERKEVWSQIWRVFTEAGIKFQQSGDTKSATSAMSNVSKLLDKVGVSLTASGEPKETNLPKPK